MRSMTTSLAMIALLLASGCSRSPRVTYYTLTPESSPRSAAQPPQPLSVVVGPVTIPELVNRPQLVVRVAPNRVDVLESHRWAEPLKTEIPRLLAQDLGQLLGSSRVTAYGQASGGEPQYRVLLDITRLEAIPGEGVTVEANWLVRGTGSARREGRALVREKVSGTGYEALAAAFSRALAGVSAEVAKTVQGEASLPK